MMGCRFGVFSGDTWGYFDIFYNRARITYTFKAISLETTSYQPVSPQNSQSLCPSVCSVVQSMR